MNVVYMVIAVAGMAASGVFAFQSMRTAKRFTRGEAPAAQSAPRPPHDQESM